MISYHSDNESDNMQERHEQLLKLVINQYIATAEPIGSKFLVAEAGLTWSEATVRNDLRALEEAGYLTHPHTSAGRVPTSKGYRHYLDILDWKAQRARRRDLEKLVETKEAAGAAEQAKRQLAKMLVELTSELVLVTESLSSFYYTGLSSLFAQPEFKEIEEVTNFSRLFDQFERCVAIFNDHVTTEPRCFVGGEHPFGDRLGVVAAKFGARGEGIIIVLGPERMDYSYCLPLVIKTQELLQS